MHSSPRRRQISARAERQFDPFVNPASPSTRPAAGLPPNETTEAEPDILKQSLLHQLNARIGNLPDSPFQASTLSTGIGSSVKRDQGGAGCRFADKHRSLFDSMQAISSPSRMKTPSTSSVRKGQRPLLKARRTSQRLAAATASSPTTGSSNDLLKEARPTKRDAGDEAVDSPAKRRRIARLSHEQVGPIASPLLKREPTKVMTPSASLPQPKSKTHPAKEVQANADSTVGTPGARELKRLDLKKQAVQARKTSKMRSPGKTAVKPGWK